MAGKGQDATSRYIALAPTTGATARRLTLSLSEVGSRSLDTYVITSYRYRLSPDSDSHLIKSP